MSRTRIGAFAALAAFAFGLNTAAAGDLDLLVLKHLLKSAASPSATADSATARATVTGNGFFQVTANIKIKSPSLAPTKLYCSLNAYVYADGSHFGEDQTVQVTPKSGAATCVIKMAFSWPGLAADDTVDLSLSVGTTANTETPETTVTKPIDRNHDRPLASELAIQTNGSTKAFTVDVVL